MTTAERDAIRRDAGQRLAELRAVRDLLRPDTDDAEILSEFVSIESQIAVAEAVLNGRDDETSGAGIESSRGDRMTHGHRARVVCNVNFPDETKDDER